LQPIDVACARAFKAALAKHIDFLLKHPEQLICAKDTEASRAQVTLRERLDRIDWGKSSKIPVCFHWHEVHESEFFGETKIFYQRTCSERSKAMPKGQSQT
jgi:hypothetical protein